MENRAAAHGFYDRLRDCAVDNGRCAVEVYLRELPEVRALATNDHTRTVLVDFAVWLRRREADLSAKNAPYTETDLEHIAALGREHGAKGISPACHRRILALHTTLTLREIHESAGPNDIAPMTHMLHWLTTRGCAAKNSYIRGYLADRKHVPTVVRRVQTFASLLLTDSPRAGELANSINMEIAERYLLMVVRLPDSPISPTDPTAEKIVDTLLKRWHVPTTWHEPGELVALLPTSRTEPAFADTALSMARDIARMLNQPCSIGTTTGHAGALAEALTLAQHISRTAPAEAKPCHLHTIADLFVELGVTQLPQIDHWLYDLAQRLTAGPDLLATLHTYYQHDMNRLRTANALFIHPRTLDYRLNRVRQLVGITPGSTRGVRILTATVTRALARRNT